MTYHQLQQLAKTLRAQGLIAKNFKLTQKASILKAKIEKVTGQKIDTETVTIKSKKVNQLQKTAKKIEEKVNLCTVKGPQLKKAFTNNGLKWTNQIWFVVNYWNGPSHKLSWDNLEKSAKPGPKKIIGFTMAAVNNLRRVGYIPA